MPENAQEIHARAANALRSPDVQEWWATWPFEGPVRPRALSGTWARARTPWRGRRRLLGLRQAR